MRIVCIRWLHQQKSGKTFHVKSATMHSLHAILLEILRKKLEFMRVNDANQ